MRGRGRARRPERAWELRRKGLARGPAIKELPRLALGFERLAGGGGGASLGGSRRGKVPDQHISAEKTLRTEPACQGLEPAPARPLYTEAEVLANA